MPEISIEGTKIFFREAGVPGGKTIVFVHGAGGSSYTWTHILNSPPPGHRSIAIDLPGHGQSEGNGMERIEDYCDFLKKFIKALSPGPHILVGHSMGGAISQLYVLGRPEGLERLVLVGTGARLRVASMVFQVLEGDFKTAIRTSSAWLFSEKTSQDVIQAYLQDTLKGTAKIMIGDFRACNAFDVMDKIQGISFPTLIICGVEDKLTPAKYSQFLHDKIMGSILEIVPDAGHMITLEKPQEFNRFLLKFINSIV